MQEYIEKLVEFGFSIEDARLFVEHIAQEAYEGGYDEGRHDEPAIISETLGQSGMGFYEWWNQQVI